MARECADDPRSHMWAVCNGQIVRVFVVISCRQIVFEFGTEALRVFIDVSENSEAVVHPEQQTTASFILCG